MKVRLIFIWLVMFCIASFCFANQDPNTESEEVISKECLPAAM